MSTSRPHPRPAADADTTTGSIDVAEPDAALPPTGVPRPDTGAGPRDDPACRRRRRGGDERGRARGNPPAAGTRPHRLHRQRRIHHAGDRRSAGGAGRVGGDADALPPGRDPRHVGVAGRAGHGHARGAAGAHPALPRRHHHRPGLPQPAAEPADGLPRAVGHELREPGPLLPLRLVLGRGSRGRPARAHRLGDLQALRHRHSRRGRRRLTGALDRRPADRAGHRRRHRRDPRGARR